MSAFLDPSELLANAMLGCLLKGAIEYLQKEGWKPEKPKVETTEKVLYLTDSKSGKVPVWQKNRSTENFCQNTELRQEKSFVARQTQAVEIDFSSRTASGRRLFLQRDPLGYVDGMGLYTYVRGNPINGFDPYGTNTHWHHELPQAFRDTHFRPLGIDINDPSHGVFLNDKDHRIIHGKNLNYNKEWGGFLDKLDRSQLTPRAKIAAINDFKTEITSAPKFNSVLRKGTRIPAGLNYKDYQDMSSSQKHDMFKSILGNKNAGRAFKVVKAGGKVVKVVAIVAAPSIYADGSSYAQDVYGANSFVSGMSGVSQVVLPMGPADATGTWDQSEAQIREGDSGAAAMFDTILNPTSPRWLPHRIFGKMFNYGPFSEESSDVAGRTMDHTSDAIISRYQDMGDDMIKVK